MKAPFQKLLGFLEDAGDQNEFLKVAAEVGIGDADIELGKLLVALQLYKAYYAEIPGQIRAVHEDALAEIRRIRDEAESTSNRASSDASRICEWAEEIHGSLRKTEPSDIASLVHKRLWDETVAILSGSVHAMTTARGQLDAATQKMNVAAYQATTAIAAWQTLSLRRVWASALCISLGVALLCLGVLWLVFMHSRNRFGL